MAKPTRVSDLADVATCQRRVYLKGKYGMRETAQQAVAKKRGIEMHDRAFKQSHPESKEQDKRCFVATSVYGIDAVETQALRKFRDDRLMASWGGKLFVTLYYALSPAFVSASNRIPVLSRVSRKVLDYIVVKVSR